MEKKRMFNASGIKSVGLKIFMLLFSCMLSFAAYAQNSTAVGTGADPYQSYIAKNPASSLVKLYQHNPEIGQSYQAMRYAVILDNPRNFGDYTQEDLEHMRNELKNLMVGIDNIDAMVQKGENYEKAAAMITRQMSSKKAMDEQTRGSQISNDNSAAPAAPSLMAPKQ